MVYVSRAKNEVRAGTMRPSGKDWSTVQPHAQRERRGMSRMVRVEWVG